MRLQAYNPSTDNLEKSYLSNPYTVGSTSIVVKNNDNFAANDRILIGEMGREKSEIVTVSAVNGDKITMTVGATKFAHSADDPVYKLRYDQVKFYRSTTGSAGTYTNLSGSPVAMDVDNTDKKTYFEDSSGLPSYYYEVSYVHSVASVESDLSDPIPGSGYAANQVGTVVNDFLTDVDDLEQNYVTVSQALSWMNEVNQDLMTQSRKPYRFLRKNPPWTLSTTAGNNRISLPTDLTFFDFAQYYYTDGDITWQQVQVVPLEEILMYITEEASVNYDDDVVQKVAIDENTNELVIFPTPYSSQSSVFKVYGWTSFNRFTSMANTVQTPTARIYKLFLMSKYWQKRAIKESSFRALATDALRDYNTEIVKMQRANRIDIGTPRGMAPDRRRDFYYAYKYR